MRAVNLRFFQNKQGHALYCNELIADGMEKKRIPLSEMCKTC